MRKIFTLEEARLLLPVLGSLLTRARDCAIRAAQADAEMQALSQRIFLSGGMHVDLPAAARRRADREKAIQEAKVSIAEIEEIGAQVADVEEGRLEFPYALDGREVLLCWTIGEDDQILHWREDEEDSPLKSIADIDFRRDKDRPN